MPELNVAHRQPIAALWYKLLAPIAASLFVLFLGLSFGTSAALNGAGIPHLGTYVFLGTLLFVALALLYPILYYYFFSYEISEHAINIHSGVIFRQYETINFSRIQTLDNERGPILMLFGLTLFEIWTASPDQTVIIAGKISNPRPDTTVLLKRSEAEALKEFIAHRPTSSTL